VLLDHADAILARLADAEAELEALAGLRGGRVRLTSFPTAGASLIPPAVAAFRDRHPKVEVELSVSGPAEAVDRLRIGAVDLAVLLESGFDPERGDDRIERTPLLHDPLFAALPASHPLARKRRLKLTELADETWIEDDSSCPDAAIFLRACHAAGFEPRVALHNDDYGAIQGFIAAGVGVALIPQLALQSVRDDVAIRPLAEPTPVRRVVGATLADGHRTPATQAMLDILATISADYLPRRPKLATAA
jgi:DNA-binding transcriptional LysR family regulator